MIKQQQYVYVGNPRIVNISKPLWGTVGTLYFDTRGQYWLNVNESVSYKVERNELMKTEYFIRIVSEALEGKKLYWEFYDEKVEIDHFDIALPFYTITIGNIQSEFDEEHVVFWLAEPDGESYQLVTTANTNYALYVIRIQTEGCKISQLLTEYLYDCFLTFGEECDTL